MALDPRVRHAIVWRVKKYAGAASRMVLKRLGIQILGQNLAIRVPEFYTPIPNPDDFPANFWDTEVPMVGIDLNEAEALRLMRDVFPAYVKEFQGLYPIEKPEGETKGFHLINGSYMAVDAHVLHAMIRHYKPKRVMEIGSGASTLVTQGAVQCNRVEDAAYQCQVSAIDPYPSAWLKHADSSVITIITKKIQEVPLEHFDALEAGDILFIDSSHVVREGNDVLREYLEIIPRLKPGVLVHVHDISLPRRYPKVYFDMHLYWTEQYLLQAYLTHNNRAKVLWPGNYMLLRHPEAMLKTFPEIADMRRSFPASEASAFWFVTC